MDRAPTVVVADMQTGEDCAVRLPTYADWLEVLDDGRQRTHGERTRTP